MFRCLELAEMGAGYTAPNPLVGAVLVHEGRIIGEGWHRKYGEAHAEVNCIASVKEADRPLIAQSTLYVSLEPCAHQGKTPPCTDLILQHKIPKVIVGCRDPFPAVNGKGIEQLVDAGVEVFISRDHDACVFSNRRFFCFHEQHRPYVILKWAQTADGIIGSNTNERLLISNEQTNRLVHRWRSQEAAILVGTETALKDNPSLTVRLYDGPSPVKLLLDTSLRVPDTQSIFSGGSVVVFNYVKDETRGHIRYYKISPDEPVVFEMMKALHELKILSVLVEGGARMLQSFVHASCWDEARVIVNDKEYNNDGVKAPVLSNASLAGDRRILDDTILYYRPLHG